MFLLLTLVCLNKFISMSNRKSTSIAEIMEVKEKYIITEKKSWFLSHLRTSHVVLRGIYFPFGKSSTTVSSCSTFRNMEVFTKASHLKLVFLPSFHWKELKGHLVIRPLVLRLGNIEGLIT